MLKCVMIMTIATNEIKKDHPKHKINTLKSSSSSSSSSLSSSSSSSSCHLGEPMLVVVDDLEENWISALFEALQ